MKSVILHIPQRFSFVALGMAVLSAFANWGGANPLTVHSMVMVAITFALVDIAHAIRAVAGILLTACNHGKSDSSRTQ
jgi:hypothetical protein